MLFSKSFLGTGNSEIPESVGKDLALLAESNHTIISRGSFSTWAAILCGGDYYGEYGFMVFPQNQNKKRSKKPPR